MKHIKLFEEYVDKGYLNDDIGVLYDPKKKMAYVASNHDEDIKFVIKDIDQEEFEEIIGQLRKNNHAAWQAIVKSYGFKVGDFREYKHQPIEKGEFWLDGFEEPIKGWTFGEDWNGFECPYFEEDQAIEISKLVNGKYDKKDQSFTFPDESDDIYRAELILTPDGVKKVWPIGAYNWTWTKGDLK